MHPSTCPAIYPDVEWVNKAISNLHRDTPHFKSKKGTALNLAVCGLQGNASQACLLQCIEQCYNLVLWQAELPMKKVKQRRRQLARQCSVELNIIQRIWSQEPKPHSLHFSKPSEVKIKHQTGYRVRSQGWLPLCSLGDWRLLVAASCFMNQVLHFVRRYDENTGPILVPLALAIAFEHYQTILARIQESTHIVGI